MSLKSVSSRLCGQEWEDTPGGRLGPDPLQWLGRLSVPEGWVLVDGELINLTSAEF